MKKAILLLIITKLLIVLSIVAAKADNETTDYSINISGKQINTDNQVIWTLESEYDVDFYIIEFSRDAANWAKIGETSSNGNSDDMVSYTYVHSNAEAGVTFYRISQIFTNGTIAYSKTITINSKQEIIKNSFYIYPNPVKDVAVINIALNDNFSWKFSLTDLHGNKISNESIDMIKGNNNLKFDFSKLSDGIYLFEITDNNGYRQTIKILKK